MEWKKTVALDDIINICIEYLEGNISQEELIHWAEDNIKVRFYLPLSKKYSCVNLLINKLNYSEDAVYKSIEFEMNKFWYILLEYTNIDNSEENKFTIENYDVIYSCFGAWIFASVQIDYKIIENIIDCSMNYLNLISLTNIVSEFNSNDLKSLSKTDKEILNILKKPDALKNIADILNGDLSKEEKVIKKEIQKNAIKIAKETIK